MKTRTQQIFFIISIILFGISLFVGLNIKPTFILPVSIPLSDVEPHWDEPFTVIENLAKGKSFIWKKLVPVFGDDQWGVDVFTPPRIYINPITGVFESTAYQYQERKSIPTIEIIEVKKEAFRYQLNGFVETNLNDASQSTLLLYDLLQGEALRIPFRKGLELGDGSSMDSFTIVQSLQENGGIKVEGVLMVNLPNCGQIALKSSETTYTARLLVQLLLNGHLHQFDSDHSQVVIDSYQIEWIESDSNFPLFVFHATNLSSLEVHQIQKTASLTQLNQPISYE